MPPAGRSSRSAAERSRTRSAARRASRSRTSTCSRGSRPRWRRCSTSIVGELAGAAPIGQLAAHVQHHREPHRRRARGDGASAPGGAGRLVPELRAAERASRSSSSRADADRARPRRGPGSSPRSTRPSARRRPSGATERRSPVGERQREEDGDGEIGRGAAPSGSGRREPPHLRRWTARMSRHA